MELDVHKYVGGVRTLLETVKISREDRLGLACLTWYKDPDTLRVYATRKGRRVFLKEVIKGEKGPWVHANGDPRDYTRNNLIRADRNVRTIKRTEGTSKFVGVCHVPGRKKPWKGVLAGKLLGYFETEEAAADARLKALNDKNPMVNFVPACIPFEEEMDQEEGSGTLHVPNQVAGGVPDAYLDLDDMETVRPDFSPYTMGYDSVRISTFVKVPPPAESRN